MIFKKCICFLFGHKWTELNICYRAPIKAIRRSSILNRKGGKKRTQHSTSFTIKRKDVVYCERCGKEKK